MLSVLLATSAGSFFALPALSFPSSGGLWVCLACALIASMLTIRLFEGAVRLSLELPLVAGLWVLNAPPWFVMVSALVCASMPTIRSVFQHRAIGVDAVCENLMWTALAVAGGLIVGSMFGEPLARALGFVAVASFVGCLPHLSSKKSSRELSGSAWIDIAVVGWTLFAMTMVMAQVAHLPWIPVLCLGVVIVVRQFLTARQSVHSHYFETLVGLMLMLQRAHPYTHGHLDRVARCAERVALKLGLGRRRAAMVKDAAILHDIGKIAVDEAILDKPAKLTDAEFDHVKKHSAMGANILANCPAFESIVPWVMHHHERPDGNGYPDRLPDVKIPIESKIIAVVDAFDAMVGGAGPGGKRTYREPMSISEALIELDRCAGTQFDPDVVRAFREVVMEGGI